MTKVTVENTRDLLFTNFVDRRGRSSRADAFRAVDEMWSWSLPRLGRWPAWWFNWRFHSRFDLPDDLAPGPFNELDWLLDQSATIPSWQDPSGFLAAVSAWRHDLPPIDRTLLDDSTANIPHLTPLYLELLRRLDAKLPTPCRVAPEANEADLAGLILHRMIGDFTPERRAVLEALLTADRGNQQFFGRLTFAVAAVEWLTSPQPDWNAPPPPRPPLREQVVTWAFIVGCVVAVGSVIYAVTK